MLAKRGFIRRLVDCARARGRCDFMREVVARPDRPRRCTLPITALRVTPPSRPAIWLALSPSDHSFFKRSTRSSFQAIRSSPALAIPAGSTKNARNPAILAGAGKRVQSTRVSAWTRARSADDQRNWEQLRAGADDAALHSTVLQSQCAVTRPGPRLLAPSHQRAICRGP